MRSAIKLLAAGAALLSAATTSEAAGVCYSPFHADAYFSDPSAVKSVLLTDLAQIATTTSFAAVRTYHAQFYGQNVIDAVVASGLQAAIGIQMVGENGLSYAYLADDIAAAVAAAKSHPESVLAIYAGNENLINGDFGSSSADEIIKVIKMVKSALNGTAGVNVPVGSVQRLEEWLHAPDADRVAAASDVVGVNMYPFFTKGAEADMRGSLEAQWAQITTKFGAKARLTETGWPTQGAVSDAGNAPSLANAQKYYQVFTQWAASHSSPFYFMMYDLLSAHATSDYEKHFGLSTASGALKFSLNSASSSQVLGSASEALVQVQNSSKAVTSSLNATVAPVSSLTSALGAPVSEVSSSAFSLATVAPALTQNATLAPVSSLTSALGTPVSEVSSSASSLAIVAPASTQNATKTVASSLNSTLASISSQNASLVKALGTPVSEVSSSVSSLAASAGSAVSSASSAASSTLSRLSEEAGVDVDAAGSAADGIVAAGDAVRSAADDAVGSVDQDMEIAVGSLDEVADEVAGEADRSIDELSAVAGNVTSTLPSTTMLVSSAIDHAISPTTNSVAVTTSNITDTIAATEVSNSTIVAPAASHLPSVDDAGGVAHGSGLSDVEDVGHGSSASSFSGTIGSSNSSSASSASSSSSSSNGPDVGDVDTNNNAPVVAPDLSYQQTAAPVPSPNAASSSSVSKAKELETQEAQAKRAREVSGQQGWSIQALTAAMGCAGIAAIAVIAVYVQKRRLEESDPQISVTTADPRDSTPSVYSDPLGTRFSSIVMITPNGDGVCIL